MVFISAGWLCVVGGVWGAIGCATAGKFYKSDFANQDGVIPEEDSTTQGAVSPKQRWGLTVLCIAIAIVGLFWIQHDHNWKPFRLDGWVLSGR